MNIIGHLCRIGAWHRKEHSRGEKQISTVYASGEYGDSGFWRGCG